MEPGMRRLVAVLLLALALARITSTPPVEASGPKLLDARVGGARATFESKYDDPADASEDGEESVRVTERYAIAGFEDVSVSYYQDMVISVTFSPSSDEADQTSPSAPNEAHWDKRKAARFAKRFLPRDADCDREAVEETALVRAVACRSKRLKSAVDPEILAQLEIRGKAGDVFYRLHLDDAGRVHSVEVQLGDGTRAFHGDGTIPEASVPFTPVRIVIPAIGVDATIEPTPIVDRVMGIPSDPWNVGWYPSLATPGDGGNVVMAGHVDWWGVGPVVFANLASLWPGATIYVVGSDGTGASYVVTSVYAVPYNTRAAEVTGSLGVEGLTLITCTGTFNGSHYDSRLVVRAERF
jgi:hypothetical protein